MQRLEVSGAVRPIYGSLGVKRLINIIIIHLSGGLSQDTLTGIVETDSVQDSSVVVQ